jgi:c-di-GMP-binding flagellar brake protein YcgR
MVNSVTRKQDTRANRNGWLQARTPFSIETENQRKFVRVEIALPVAVKQIKDQAGNFIPEEDVYTVNGNILNISATGMLVDLESPVSEGDVVLIRFVLQDVEPLDNVLGIVKRMDADDERYLVGIEFIGCEELRDRLTQDQFETVKDSVCSFENRVRETLIRYLY